MKHLLLTGLLALASALPAAAAVYEIDARHTQVFFTYTHNGYSHLRGRLNEVSGTFDFDPADPAKSSIQVQLPLSSLSTGVARLDTHLKSADFFDATQFPTAAFKSTGVTVKGKDRLAVAGDLTLKGVTRPVVFDVTVNSTAPNGFTKLPAAGFDAHAVIKRSDFGVDGMLGAVPDEVAIDISMEARVPKPAEPAAAAN
jgi:polyisoprenoid-binding protein YceI